MADSITNSPAVQVTTGYIEVIAPVGGFAAAGQAAAGTTAATTTTPWGFATSTQANAAITLIDAMRTSLISAGLIKGSA